MARIRDPRRTLAWAFLGVSSLGLSYTLWAGLTPPLWLLRNGIVLGAMCAGINCMQSRVSSRIGSTLPFLSLVIFIFCHGIMSDFLGSYFVDQWRALAKVQFSCTAIMSFTAVWLVFGSSNKRQDHLAEPYRED